MADDHLPIVETPKNAGRTLRWRSEEDTDAFARALAAAPELRDAFIALHGDLGAGKTTFVQGLAAGAGVTEPVTSPTFALIHEYAGGRVPLVHADLYRIEDARELDEIGLDEHVRAGAAAVIVEWADRAPALLPPGYLRVELSHDGEARRLRATATGALEQRVDRWALRLATAIAAD
jgi:tRNA threonylcarbamoyladenosine biosynthesis protein TsaE